MSLASATRRAALQLLGVAPLAGSALGAAPEPHLPVGSALVQEAPRGLPSGPIRDLFRARLDAANLSRQNRYNAASRMDPNILALRSVSQGSKLRMLLEKEEAEMDIITKLQKELWG